MPEISEITLFQVFNWRVEIKFVILRLKISISNLEIWMVVKLRLLFGEILTVYY